MMRKKPKLAYHVTAKPVDYSKPTFIQPNMLSTFYLLNHYYFYNGFLVIMVKIGYNGFLITNFTSCF